MLPDYVTRYAGSLFVSLIAKIPTDKMRMKDADMERSRGGTLAEVRHE